MTGNQQVDADTLYTAGFFQVFAAVVLFMTGVALQFHFGQYMAFLGYGVDTLGHVLAAGAVGTLLIRLQFGKWIDRFGCRATWIVASTLVAVAVCSMQFAERLWLVIALRTVSTMAISGAMTTVAVFAAQVAPPRRRAESIGTMGLAGFLGMIMGPTLGDWIFAGDTASIVPYRIFFTASAACSLLAGGILMLVPVPRTAGAPTSAREEPIRGREPVIRVILKHWPGSVLLVGVVFSMVFCLQTAFLERLAEERGFMNVKLFFLTYGPSAMVLRIIFRRLPERLGRTRTLLGGLLLLAVGLLGMIGIHSEWQLVLPGLIMGAGHCFVFPSMVDLSAASLPAEHRGLGTSLILGAGDLGMLSGYFLLGELTENYGFDTALATLAVTVLAGAACFGVARRRVVFRPTPRDQATTNK